MANEQLLIDVNVLINAIDQYMKKVYDCPLSEIEEYQRNSRDTKCIYLVQGLCEAVEICEDAPTVDAAPVVHGRWIHKGAWHIECSECQYILAHIGEAKNYCPNCGAKMDGGNEDG